MGYLLLFILSSIFAAFAETVAPSFNGSEIKIIYSCSIIDRFAKSDESKETVIFYEVDKRTLLDQGLVLRLRENKKSQDFTVKFGGSPMNFDRKIYEALSESNSGSLKCEWDVTYDPKTPKFSPSCSFKTDGHAFEQEHLDFVIMTGRVFKGFQGSLDNLREVTIESTQWKLRGLAVDTIKKPVLERWMIGNKCKLEASAKIDGTSKDEVLKAISALKNAINENPDPEQGSKTAWALSL